MIEVTPEVEELFQDLDDIARPGGLLPSSAQNDEAEDLFAESRRVVRLASPASALSDRQSCGVSA